MSLLSRFFYKRPPDGLLEVTDRVYVFDSCFSTEVLPDGIYQLYLHEIINDLHEDFPESLFLAFNFREGEKKSHFAKILCEYDVTVLDYPRQYEGCPLLPLSLIHHFLRVSESWLSLGNCQNIVLLHCERGGWALLAFVLASFLVFKKLHSGERKTLEMIYREGPRGLLQLLSPLNPFASQLRYLQYISRRNIPSEWPPYERPLSLDCIILRAIPRFDDQKGCRPVIRIFGRNFLSRDGLSTQMLYSMQKRGRNIRHYCQKDSDVIKIDIQCLVQGDVVLECVHLDLDTGREVMMFRIMFNTAFIRSNILMLNCENLDILWDSKSRFSKSFRAEVLFGDVESSSSAKSYTSLLNGEEKGGLPIEAFSKVQDLFSDADWVDTNDDATLWLLKQLSAMNDSRDISVIRRMSGYASPLDSEEENNASSVADSLDFLDSDKASAPEFNLLDDRFSLDSNLEEVSDNRPCEDQVVSATSPPLGSVYPVIAVDEQQVSHCISEEAQETSNDVLGFQSFDTSPLSSSDGFASHPLHPPLSSLNLNVSLPTALPGLSEGSLLAVLPVVSTEDPTQPFHVPVSAGQLSSSSASDRTGSPNAVQSLSSPSFHVHPMIIDQGFGEAPFLLPPPLHSHEASEDCCSTTSPSTGATFITSVPLLSGEGTCGSIPDTHPLPPPLPSGHGSISALPVPQSPTLQAQAIVAAEPPPPLISPSPSLQPILEFTPDSLEMPVSVPGVGPLLTPILAVCSSDPGAPSIEPPAYSDGDSVPQTSSIDSESSIFPPPSSQICDSALTTAHFQTHGSFPMPPQSRGSVPIPPPPPPPQKNHGSVPTPPPQSCGSIPTPPNRSCGSILAPKPPPQGHHSVPTPPPPPQGHHSIPTPPPPPHSCRPVPFPPPPPPQYHRAVPPPPPPPPQTHRSVPLPPPPPQTSGLAPTPPPRPQTTGQKSPFHHPSNRDLSPTAPPLQSIGSAPAPPVPPPPPPRSRSSAPVPPPPPPQSHGLAPSPLLHSSSSGPPAPPPPPSGHPTAPPPPPPPGRISATAVSETPSVTASELPAPPAPGKSSIVPPPPTLGRGRGFPARGKASPSSIPPKKTSLKPLHWVKVTRAMQGSLWADSQKQDAQAKAPEIDISELESLFSVASTSDQANKAGTLRVSKYNKPEKVQLVDLRRAYNCEIMLTKIKISLSEMNKAILALDSSALDIDQVESLIKFCPTKEEMETLKNYKGDKEMLGKCEQFFLELMKVPRVEPKLRVFAFTITFSTQVEDLKRNLNTINDAAREVKESLKLRQIMQTILTLGNALNQGTARGSAVGFKLDSLLKLSDTRARNNKMTLMHYLCKILAEKMPELLDFSKDLVHLEPASKIQLKSLAEEMQAVSKGLEKVEQELITAESDGAVSSGFQKVLKSFLDSAEAEVRSLISLYSEVGRNADSLSHYFGEDPARCPFEQVTQTLVIFIKIFNKAHEENEQQAEAEKKKLEKEALKDPQAAAAFSPARKESIDALRAKLSLRNQN